jgi:serpin B
VLDADSKLALVNAVHFKGAWAQPFVAEATRAEGFETAPGTKVDVPTMRGEIETRYVDGKDAQIVALPFKSEGALSLELDVVLPKGGAATSFASWSRAIEGGGHAAVDLSLPKFKIGSSFQLAKTLGEMGMPTAFLPSADFGAMTGESKLHISAVVHQAVLDVNESGAEASAATAVVMADEAAHLAVRMRVDRPFYVMIRDRKSGALLFAAHVRNPKA